MRNLVYWGLPTLALIINSVILLLLGLSKKDKQIKVLMYFISVMILWAASSLLMKLQIYPGVLFWNRVMVTSITLVPFFAYIFVSFFTNQVRLISIAIWSIIILLITVLNFLGFMVTSAQMIPVIINNRESFELSYALGPLATFGFGSIFILLAVCLEKMRVAYKQGDTQSNKLKPVLLGLFILYAGMIINVLPELGKYPIDFGFGLVTSALLFKAIYSNKLVELKIVVTRTVLYTMSFSILFLLIAFVVNQVLSLFSGLSTGINNQVFVLLTTAATIFLFMPIFQMIQKRIDGYFYKRQNFNQNLIRDFSITASNNLNLENITNELLEVAYKITNNPRIYVFLNNQENKEYSYFASYKKLDRLTFTLRYSHPFIRWFKNMNDHIAEEYVVNHPFFKTMWDKEVQDLLLMRFEAALPLKYNTDLIGMVLLGHNDSARSMGEETMNFMSTLCATASIAINNARMFEKFQNEAILDSLTGLYNHRYFMDSIEKACFDCKGRSVALIMINLDMFAMFNDIYGHHAGDLVLKRTAEAIDFVCGSQGIKCRYGGDIFAIIMPDTDSNRAYELSEKIRLRIESTSMSQEGESNRFVTISTGISVAPTVAKNEKDLVDKATRALLHAKKTGKNKSVLFDVAHHQDAVDSVDSEEFNMATIYALTAAIDAKDHYTFGHSQRVAKYASAIAEKAGASKEEVETIRQAALLHDVGKIGIPESILTKITRLENHEYETMKNHVDMSITIIKYLPSFSHVIPAVLGHHERWDGKGYPRGVMGENIPFAARCVGIADAFDAITSNRHYKSQLSIEYAIDEIEKNAGTQFDPVLAKLFVSMIRSEELIIEPSRTYVDKPNITRS